MNNVNIRQFEALDLIHLSREMIEDGCANHPDLLKWAEASEEAGPATTWFYKEKMIGCGGVRIYWQGVGEAWSVFPKWVMPYRRYAFWCAKTELERVIQEFNLVRVCATFRVDLDEKTNWLKHLGFEKECLMKKYCPDGTDAYLYAIVR